MPTIITRGAGNAAGYGFGAIPLGPTLGIVIVVSHPTNGIGTSKVSLDSSGNPIGAFQIGSSPLRVGNQSVLVAKLNTAGSLQWQTLVYSNSSSACRHVQISSQSPNLFGDGSGNIILLGNAAGCSVSCYRATGWVGKFNSSGTLTNNSGVYDSAFCNRGAGIYNGGIDSSGNAYGFGSSHYGCSAVYGWWAKFSSASSYSSQKAYQAAGGSGTYMCGNSTDSSGNSYVSGYTGIGLHGFFGKLNNTGGITWSTGTNQTCLIPYYTSSDSSGNGYYLGWCQAARSNGFLLKFNSSGTLQYQKKYTFSSSTPVPISMEICNTNGTFYAVYKCVTPKAIIVNGKTACGSINWQKTLGVSGSFNTYSAKLDSTGSNLWVSGYTNCVSPGVGLLIQVPIKPCTTPACAYSCISTPNGSINVQFQTTTSLTTVSSGCYSFSSSYNLATASNVLSSTSFNNTSNTSPGYTVTKGVGI